MLWRTRIATTKKCDCIVQPIRETTRERRQVQVILRSFVSYFSYEAVTTRINELISHQQLHCHAVCDIIDLCWFNSIMHTK